jgi:hypothetical protein
LSKPLATNPALYMSMLPSACILILLAHLQLIGILLGGSEVSFHILFFNNELNSTLIAACHSLASFLAIASWNVFGACNEINATLA